MRYGGSGLLIFLHGFVQPYQSGDGSGVNLNLLSYVVNIIFLMPSNACNHAV